VRHRDKNNESEGGRRELVRVPVILDGKKKRGKGGGRGTKINLALENGPERKGTLSFNTCPFERE